ncbi:MULTISPECIES: hypothetical protein [Staphylococcus]|uniref:Pathogenicity island protein n=1 Tax=Staphylococcus equorum TaxID=246432 RepID=A0AAW7API7_9STAP|nr:hypothetical protein [Staphylococcus equorum]MDK9849746.1 hypothetical protein [Staphylococcus equorum]MDK9867055.1 hypothetical protein [Staphylococcus equorum]
MIGNMYERIQQRNNYKRERSVYKLGLNNHTNEPYKEITHEMFNKLIQQRDQYKAENEKLKEEVEHLNSVIQEEEDWKLLELEERWE